MKGINKFCKPPITVPRIQQLNSAEYHKEASSAQQFLNDEDVVLRNQDDVLKNDDDALRDKDVLRDQDNVLRDEDVVLEDDSAVVLMDGSTTAVLHALTDTWNILSAVTQG